MQFEFTFIVNGISVIVHPEKEGREGGRERERERGRGRRRGRGMEGGRERECVLAH